MQGLFDLQLLASVGLVKDGILTPLDGILGIPGIHVKICSATADVSVSMCLQVLPRFGLQSPDGLTNVDLSTAAGDVLDYLGAFSFLW